MGLGCWMYWIPWKMNVGCNKVYAKKKITEHTVSLKRFDNYYKTRFSDGNIIFYEQFAERR